MHTYLLFRASLCLNSNFEIQDDSNMNPTLFDLYSIRIRAHH